MSDNIKPQRETENTSDDASRKTNSLVDTWGDWVDNLSEEEFDILEVQDTADEEKYGLVFLEEDNPEAYARAKAEPLRIPPEYGHPGDDTSPGRVQDCGT